MNLNLNFNAGFQAGGPGGFGGPGSFGGPRGGFGGPRGCQGGRGGNPMMKLMKMMMRLMDAEPAAALADSDSKQTTFKS